MDANLIVRTFVNYGIFRLIIAVPVLAVLLGLRIGIGERELRAGLEGHGDFAARVRYRLMPLVW